MSEPLISQRTILDVYRPSDVSNFLKLVQDIDVMKYVGGTKEKDKAEKLFDRFLKNEDRASSDHVWAIRSVKELDYIGHAALFKSDICQSPTEREILFYLSKPFWKNGLAVEVGATVLEFAFQNRLFNRVWATIDSDHVVSKRVCEKIGMSIDRIGHDEGDFLVMKCESSGIYMSLKIVKFNSSLEYLSIEVTELLHESYATLVAAGMTATVHQDSETTLKRLNSGDSFFGFVNSKLVATITVVPNVGEEPIGWFSKPGIFHFTQFAVRSVDQGTGYGAKLLNYAESYARSKGALELALDTSEKAEGLINWYKKRGYRIIEHCILPNTSYRSVILSKSL